MIKADCRKDLGLRIVVLDRGWVYIGYLYREGDEFFMENAYCMRSFGSSRGLGQLALEGEQPRTILDITGNINFNVRSQIYNIECNKDKWLNYYE